MLLWCQKIITFNFEKMQKIEDWYRNMPKNQKIFVYFVSIALVLVFGIGLLPLAILIYLELGKRGGN